MKNGATSKLTERMFSSRFSLQLSTSRLLFKQSTKVKTNKNISSISTSFPNFFKIWGLMQSSKNLKLNI